MLMYIKKTNSKKNNKKKISKNYNDFIFVNL